MSWTNAEGSPKRFELVRVIGFHEKAALIAVNVWYDDNNVLELARLDYESHRTSPVLFFYIVPKDMGWKIENYPC